MNDEISSPDAETPAISADSAQPAVRRLSSADLLQGEREIHIAHGDQVYRLRVTRSGKLILQK